MKKSFSNLFAVLILWLIRYIPSISAATSSMDCVPVVENRFSTMILRPNESSCAPFDCWESQLTLSSKAAITNEYNKFRNEIAVTTGSESIFKTIWHWALEKEAVSIAKECPTSKTALMATRDVYGLGFNMACEETIATFPMSEPTQASFLDMYPNLLRNQKNDILANFDAEGHFRRPSATHFGCSFVLIGNRGMLVCVYCAKASNVSHNPLEELWEECPPSTSLGGSTGLPKLCAFSFKYSDHLYGCDQVEFVSKFCKEPKKGAWLAPKTSPTKYFYPITDGHVGTYLVREVEKELNEKQSNIVFCEDLGGECLPLLPKWTYAYNKTTTEALNRTMYTQLGRKYLRYGNNNAIVKISQDDTEQYEKAGCCIYLFVTFFLTFIIVSVLAYFTYKHSVINAIQ